jgi:hypothetical protein
LALLVTTILTAAGAVCAQEPGSNPAPAPDIIFREMRLSADGVVGVDTSGQAWQYDFDQATFEKSTAPTAGGGSRPGERGGREAAVLPVEVRCTEELRVRPFERKTVTVGLEEYVDGNISVLGRVTVKGWVKGNIESITGPVIIGETGQVDGDIRSPEITVKHGGLVLGRQTISDKLVFPESLRTSFETVGLWVVFGFSLFFLLCAFLYVTLMPRQLEHFTQCIVRYPVKSSAVGLLFVVGLPVVMVLLAITLVGIIAIPFLPFVYVFAITLGVVTFGRLIGAQVARRALGISMSPLVETAIGLILFMALWTVVAVLMGSSGDVAYGFGVFALVVSIIISCFPVCSGIGAALLTRFGFRPHVSLRDRIAAEQAAVPAPAPPPIRRTTPFDVPPPAGTDPSAPDSSR